MVYGVSMALQRIVSAFYYAFSQSSWETASSTALDHCWGRDTGGGFRVYRMAGRNRMPRRLDDFQRIHDNRPDKIQRLHDGPRSAINPLNRGPRPVPIHPAAMEEEIENRHREIQRILADNRHLIDENVILQRDVVAAKAEIQHLSQVIPKMRADNDARVRELIDRGLKLEAEIHAAEPVRAQVVQLRAEVRKLDASRSDLKAEMEVLTRDYKRMRSENEQLKTLRGDIDGIRKELLEARRNLELEKKANEELALQNQTLEKNLVSMARELEKLRAGQLIADRRAYGLGGSGYGMLNSVPDVRYQSSGFSDGSGGSWGSYDRYGAPHRPQDNYGPSRR
ncbi:hypothetical protein V2J09_008617 [Rumex salicifolius]